MSQINSLEIQALDAAAPKGTIGDIDTSLPTLERRTLGEKTQAAIAATIAATAIAGCIPSEKTDARLDPAVTESTIVTSKPIQEVMSTTSTTAQDTTQTSTRPTTTTVPSVKSEKQTKEILATKDKKRLIDASGFEALSNENLHLIDDFTTFKGRRVVVVGVGEAIPHVDREEIEQDFEMAEGVLDLGETVAVKDVWLGPGSQTSVEILPRSSDLTPSRDPTKPVNDTSYIVVADKDKPLASLTSPVNVNPLANTTGEKNLPTLGLTVRNPYFVDGGVTVSLIQNASPEETIDNQPANARVMGTEVVHAVFGFDLAPRFEREVLDARRPNMDYVLKEGSFIEQKENLARLIGDAFANGIQYYVQEVRAGRQPVLHEIAQIPMLADEFQDMGVMYIPPTSAQARLIKQLV